MSRATAKATHRNDAELFADARFALDNEPTIPGTVHVHVDNGTATLTGTVRRPTERTTAARVVRHVDGVRRVINLLTVWEMTSPEGLDEQ
jgi:osmotically-inducible protein OsmY